MHVLPSICPTRPVAVDWDPALPGASVGKVLGSSAWPLTVGFLLDLNENGRWDGASGGELEQVGSFLPCVGVPIAF